MPISEIYNEDCMVGMARFPDKFFDLAVVDPPYGIGASDWDNIKSMFTPCDKWKGRKKTGYEIKGWDKSKPVLEYWNELFRVSENQIVWGANHFIEQLKNSAGMIVWDKQTSGDFSDCELAWVSFTGSVKKFEWLWNGFRKQKPENRIHPTQKPIALYKWLLQNYAKVGDKILDTHLGSQSSRIAAYKLGFDFWGWEIDKAYFDVGNKRFEKDIAEPLFQQINIEQKKLF